MSTTIDNDDFWIHQGLDTLIARDGYLLLNDLSERTITHKLAEHYQMYFNGWNVDCEYNRTLDRPKEILIDPEEILHQMADTLEENGYLIDKREDNPKIKEQLQDLERQLRNPKLEYIEELDIVLFLLEESKDKIQKKTIYPDIIVHQRGTDNNHIVIEAKKSTNVSRKARAYDLVKLMTLVSSPDFHYRRGYFVDLPIGSHYKSFREFSDSLLFSSGVYKISPK